MNVKGVDYRCILWSMTISDAINRLNNFKLYDKGNYEYGFGANKTPTEVIKEGAFGGT